MPLPFPPSAPAFDARPLRSRPPRWSLLISLGLLASCALGCRTTPPPGTPSPAAQAEALREQNRQQELAARQCRKRRQELQQDLAELRRAEAVLAEERAVPLSPLPAPPIWDESAEQRYSKVDQQLDRQRYEQELAAWNQLRAGTEDQRLRLTQAQQRLDRQAQRLQKRYPGLFTGPTSIEVKPQELERLNRCPATPA